MRQISSSLTFFEKYVFIIVWSSIFGVGAISMLISNHKDKWVFISAWVLGTIVIYFWTGKIKKVEFDGEKFIISNFLKKEVILASNVKSVSGTFFISPELVRIELKEESSFGKIISFIPRFRFNIFNQHPVVDELKKACGVS
jgi:hypothetical protein